RPWRIRWRGHAQGSIAIMVGGRKGRGPEPAQEDPASDAPAAHGAEDTTLGPPIERHGRGKFIAPATTVAVMMKRPSISIASMVLPSPSSWPQLRGSNRSRAT